MDRAARAIELVRAALERSRRQRCAFERELDRMPLLLPGLRLGVAIAHDYQRQLDELELERVLEDGGARGLALRLARRLESECGVSFDCDDPDVDGELERERDRT